MPIDSAGLKLHVEQSTLAYVKVRDSYEAFAEAVKAILAPALSEYAIHTIQARAKSFESFGEKAAKLNLKTNELKYASPLTEITDLAGIRVITYVPQTVKEVEEVIRREFVVQERLDKDAALMGTGRIGYKSIHFLVQLKESRIQGVEYSRFKDQTAEIQVRTILQHAWAEMEHDIQYKSDQQIPNELKRRFVALAGLIEIADREFESIQKEDERLRTELTIELAEGLLQLQGTYVAPAANAVPDASLPTSINGPRSGNPKIGEALSRYDNLIVSEPGQYAHYLGRAKARFLLGDRSGALEDLKTAEELAPKNEQVSTVRQRIEEGRVNGRNYASAAPQYASQGNRQLAEGNIDSALENFAKASQLGLHKIHSTFNFAMCACYMGNLGEIDEHLGKVTLHAGSFVEINHLALRLIAFKLSGEHVEDLPAMMAELNDLVAKIGTYELENSPLRFLVAALRLRHQGDVIEPIIDILHQARQAG